MERGFEPRGGLHISSFGNLDDDAKRFAQSNWADFEPVPLADLDAFSPVFSGMLAYLEGKTGGTRMARRADINPAEIPSFLPHLAIIDVVQPDKDQPADYVIRLIGTSLAAAYGEVTGKNIRDIPNQQAVARLENGCSLAMETGQPLGFFVREISTEKKHFRAASLYIPLADTDDNIFQILIVGVVTTSPL